MTRLKLSLLKYGRFPQRGKRSRSFFLVILITSAGLNLALRNLPPTRDLATRDRILGLAGQHQVDRSTRT